MTLCFPIISTLSNYIKICSYTGLTQHKRFEDKANKQASRAYHKRLHSHLSCWPRTSPKQNLPPGPFSQHGHSHPNIPSPTLNNTHPSQTRGSFIVFLSMYVARWMCWLHPLGCEGFLNFGPLACTHWGVAGGILGPSSYIKLRSAFLVVSLIWIQSGCIDPLL